MTAAEREEARRLVIDQLRQLNEAEPTAWARRGVAELPATPTPMTWATLQTWLGATGGTGQMLADLGSPPDPSLGETGAFDLVAGRPRMNLARAARMRGTDAPFRHPISAYRADPKRALAGEPALTPPRGVAGLLSLPRAAWRLYRIDAVPRALLPTFAEPFAARTLPGFIAAAKTALAEDVSALSGDELVARFGEWRRRTFIEFGCEAGKPAALAEAARRVAVGLLAPKLGRERAIAAVAELNAGATTPPAHDLSGDLARLTRGELGVGTILARFGYRAPDDLELSCPRYAERLDLLPPHPAAPTGFADLAARLDRLGASPVAPAEEPEARPRIATEARLTGPYRDRLARCVRQMRTYTGLAAAARDGLAAGVTVLRQALVALGTVSGIGDDVFFLLPNELPALEAAHPLAQTRRVRRDAELRLTVPDVLFGDELGAIGIG